MNGIRPPAERRRRVTIAAVRSISAKDRAILAAGLVLVLVASLLAFPSFANHASTTSGLFESADGNLVVNHPNDAVDWGSFTDEAVAEAWNFHPFRDRTGNPDDIFKGGVKQDDDCPGVREGSPGGGNSKLDLSRIYLANRPAA